MVWLTILIISFSTNHIFVIFPILDEKKYQKFLCKIIFTQYFFLQNLQKNRLDVNGVIIYCEKIILHQPFFISFNFIDFLCKYILRNMASEKNEKNERKYVCDICAMFCHVLLCFYNVWLCFAMFIVCLLFLAMFWP